MTLSQILGALLTLSFFGFTIYNVVDIVKKVKGKRECKKEVPEDEGTETEEG